ncbi:MAG: F0F1 ATP synthase subunit A [Rhodospirillaceae bacterium]|nr:F0F1 ATP synthase subunit A [Rhodospirillaceae bacterium]
MNELSPLICIPQFHIGLVPITPPVATTWVIIAVLFFVSFLSTRRLSVEHPGRWQTVLEGLILILKEQIAAVTRRDPELFLPLIGTLFIFILTANLTMLIPNVDAPTAYIETPAALALIVYFAAHAYGISIKGLKAYLKGYTKPNIIMLPLNILSELTRTFALMVRLFGNIMSHELVVAVVVSLAAFLVPIPFMALAVLISLIQAFIFTILAAVFLGAATSISDSQG